MDTQHVEKMIEQAKILDIAVNPSPDAIYDVHNLSVFVWATPDDYPKNHIWQGMVKDMNAGNFTKKCRFVGYFKFELKENHKPIRIIIKTVYRDSDIDKAWIANKMEYLASQAGVTVDIPILDGEIVEIEDTIEKDLQEEFERNEKALFEKYSEKIEIPIEEKIYQGLFLDNLAEIHVMSSLHPDNWYLISPIGFLSDHFSWGDQNKSSHETALCILLDYFNEQLSIEKLNISMRFALKSKAYVNYSLFLAEVIERMDQNLNWILTSDQIREWIDIHTMPCQACQGSGKGPGGLDCQVCGGSGFYTGGKIS